MKILHFQFGRYNELASYQENLLAKFHRKLGFEVTHITSTVYIDYNSGKLKNGKPEIYINNHGVKVIRIPFPKCIPWKIADKFGIASKPYKYILEENPDIIFVHSPQKIANLAVVKYAKLHKNVKVYVDNHADFSNSARNCLSRLVHKTLWRYIAKRLEPYAKKFYGVLPSRCDFLKEVYKIDPSRIELLVMGVDDEKLILDERERARIRKEVRQRYGISDDDFLIVTGGKIDNFKTQTLLLMQAVNELSNLGVKLIVFGSIIDELRDAFRNLMDDNIVKYIGWIKSDDTHKLFIASDLAAFPGGHSVLWEEAVGLGIPALFRYWPGITHIDLGGNCVFVYKDTTQEIKESLKMILNDRKFYERMKKTAIENGPRIFRYSEIAKRSIELI